MKYLLKILALSLVIINANSVFATNLEVNPDALTYKYSTTVEKERPELDDITKALIAEYRKNPTEENKQKLRAKIGESYDAVVEKKIAKLNELKATAKEQGKIDEMQVIVDEMLRDRENRIDQALSRFMDERLTPNARTNVDGFLPVLGAASNVSIAYTTVTNADYEKFVIATGYTAPSYFTNGKAPTDKLNYPVTYITYNDAVAYCEWLSKNDNTSTYRLPTEMEWEQAAGHMPKDADFNSGNIAKLMPVDTYKDTLSASGAIDMWGNVWELTSTERTTDKVAVKGGAYNTGRTECRTENRDESRDKNKGYDNVGFRIVREK